MAARAHRVVRAAEPGSAYVQSLEEGGAFNRATLARNQVLDPDLLLALRVNGADLPCTRRRVAERARDAPRGPRRSLGSERTLLHLLLHRTDCQAPCQKPRPRDLRFRALLTFLWAPVHDR